MCPHARYRRTFPIVPCTGTRIVRDRDDLQNGPETEASASRPEGAHVHIQPETEAIRHTLTGVVRGRDEPDRRARGRGPHRGPKAQTCTYSPRQRPHSTDSPASSEAETNWIGGPEAEARVAARRRTHTHTARYMGYTAQIHRRRPRQRRAVRAGPRQRHRIMAQRRTYTNSPRQRRCRDQGSHDLCETGPTQRHRTAARRRPHVHTCVQPETEAVS